MNVSVVSARSNKLADSGRSRRSRVSVLPGSLNECMSPQTQYVYKCINENEDKNLELFLAEEGVNCDVM